METHKSPVAFRSCLKLLQPHWQLANALAGGVKDCTAHRCIGADVGQLKHDDLDAGDIGIHRHQVVRQIVIDVARIALVDVGRLV